MGAPPAPAGTAEAPRLAPLTSEDPTTIGGHRLIGRVGAGGMGVVYAASAPGGGYMAIKVIHRDHAADPDFRARFAREVDLAARVASPRVPAFYGADTQAAAPWLATEFIAGRTLREHIAAHGPLRGGMLLGFAAGVAEALRVVHAAGIVHRDLKPGNVILAADGPKVLDFGIARAVEETALTRTGGLVGTPGWIAPEQYRGGEITAAADMFAWASLVAFAATGANPFGSGAPNALAYRVLRGEADLDGVPDDLLPLVRQGLHTEPDQRLDAAEAVRAAERLWRWAAASGAPAEQDEATAVVHLLGSEWTEVRTDLPAPPPRRRRGLMLAGAGALALLVAGAGTAVAAPAVIDAVAGPEADGGSEAAEGGSEGGESGESGGGAEGSGSDGSQADGGSGDDAGAEGGGDVELPPEAVDYASSGSGASNSAEVTSAGETAEVELVYSGGFAGTTVRLSGVEATSDGLTLSLELDQGEGRPTAYPDLSSEWFTLRGQGEVVGASNAFAYSTQEAGGSSVGYDYIESHTLEFPGAADSGLLTLETPSTDPQLAVPAVSVCYEVGGGFSTDYEQCVSQ